MMAISELSFARAICPDKSITSERPWVGPPKVALLCCSASSLWSKSVIAKPVKLSRLFHLRRTCQNHEPQSDPGRDEEYPMTKLTFGALVALAVTAAASTAMAQDAAAGKTSFNKCLACHAI